MILNCVSIRHNLQFCCNRSYFFDRLSYVLLLTAFLCDLNARPSGGARFQLVFYFMKVLTSGVGQNHDSIQYSPVQAFSAASPGELTIHLQLVISGG